jgi:hypothetical protein
MGERAAKLRQQLSKRIQIRNLSSSRAALPEKCHLGLALFTSEVRIDEVR